MGIGFREEQVTHPSPEGRGFTAHLINVSCKKLKRFKNDLKWVKNDLSGERLKNSTWGLQHT